MPAGNDGTGDAQPAATILVVDDDQRLRRLVSTILEQTGYAVLQAEDGDRALALITERSPDLLVLDLQMPRVSGRAVLAVLRSRGDPLGVLVLTGETDRDRLVETLEAGADDYLTKPLHAAELRARVQAILRRTLPPVSASKPDQHLVVGPVSLSTAARSVSVGSRTILLTRTEYRLLSVLMKVPGQVFTPQELLQRVWGPEFDGQEHLVRTNVYRLRRKLEQNPRRPALVRNRPGIGYYLSPSADATASAALDREMRVQSPEQLGVS
jgi:two-component system KDP operon response regulator KdpE